MDILVYLLLLIVLELIVYGLCVGTDYYLKHKHYKTRPSKWFLWQSRFDKTNTISVAVFRFQIFNFLFVFAYTLIAIIDSFFYSSTILCVININAIMIYGGVVLLGLFIVAGLSIKEWSPTN